MERESLADLVSQLSDQNGIARERARHALALIGRPAVPSLVELAGSHDKLPRWEAARALSAIADPESIPTLVGLLADSESDIRWIAAVGLVRIGPRSLPASLREAIDNPDSIEVRRAVHHVLHELAKDNRVIGELVSPVLEVLGETDPSGAIPPVAQRALKQVESFQHIDAPPW
jgi:HEAT repeat protein